MACMVCRANSDSAGRTVSSAYARAPTELSKMMHSTPVSDDTISRLPSIYYSQPEVQTAVWQFFRTLYVSKQQIHSLNQLFQISSLTTYHSWQSQIKPLVCITTEYQQYHDEDSWAKAPPNNLTRTVRLNSRLHADHFLDCLPLWANDSYNKSIINAFLMRPATNSA